jgi:CRISPR/Cas system CSM-associated protein Csm3 (group 7 of RAMP superfamily)
MQMLIKRTTPLFGCKHNLYLECHIASKSKSRIFVGSGAITGLRALSVYTCASCASLRVIVAKTGGLKEIHRDRKIQLEEFASNDWASDKSDEDHKDNKVQDRIANDSAASQLRLLERVDRGANLSTKIR